MTANQMVQPGTIACRTRSGDYDFRWIQLCLIEFYKKDSLNLPWKDHIDLVGFEKEEEERS